MRLKNKKIFFFLILVLAFFFRFLNLNWDNNHHLHPDERFLTMVSGSMSLPFSLKEYFDPQLSKLNPGNIGYNFYVYGTLPLILTKSLAVSLNMDNYNDLTILGRFLSALMDFFCVVLVYKIAKLLFVDSCFCRNDNKNRKCNVEIYFPFLAAFFYAISVYPVQSAHFFTTDTFLNFFMLTSFYFTLKSIQNRTSGFFMTLLSSLFFALALSSKISALYILPLNLGTILLAEFLTYKNRKDIIHIFIRFTFHVIRYTLLVYLFLRIFNPYYFQSANFFDFHLNQKFVESIQSLKFFSNREAWYPPGVQWINKPWYGLLLTTFLVGLGPVNFLVMVIGIVWFLKNLKLKIKNAKLQLKIKNEQVILLIILFWVLGYFVYQSLQFVKSIRYTIYLYPFYAVFGGLGIAVIDNWLKSVKKIFKNVIRYTLYVTLLLWPLLFSTIYFHKNTRVEASEWIYKNLPNQSIILGEHWDDPLPLFIENNYGKTFQVEQLPIFDPDIPEKWQKMRQLLTKADYYVLSSNRGWGSIPTVSERYPLMSKYYQALLTENCQEQVKLTGVCFQKIKEFLPFYYKFIRYPDSWVEETFTVYDQQTVMIYEKMKKL